MSKACDMSWVTPIVLFGFVVRWSEQLLEGLDAYLVICHSARVLDWLDYVSIPGQIREHINEFG